MLSICLTESPCLVKEDRERLAENGSGVAHRGIKHLGCDGDCPLLQASITDRYAVSVLLRLAL